MNMKYIKYVIHIFGDTMKNYPKKEDNYYKLKLVGERGQITIDKNIRESCNIQPGTPLLEIKVGKAIVLVQVDNMFEDMTQRLKAAFTDTKMDKSDIVKEIEETSRDAIVKKHYPDLEL